MVFGFPVCGWLSYGWFLPETFGILDSFSFFKFHRIWQHLSATRKHIKCRFQVALLVIFDCCTAVASSNSLILGFVVCWKLTIFSNHGLKRADNWLKSKGLNHKSILWDLWNTVKSYYAHSLNAELEKNSTIYSKNWAKNNNLLNFSTGCIRKFC